MKVLHFFTGIVALVLTASTTTVSAQGQAAKVTHITGSARYSAGSGGSWQTLNEGDTLKPGAVVQTASSSSVDIIFVVGDEAEAPAGPKAPPFAQTHVVPPFDSGGSGVNEVQQNFVRLRENTVLAIDKLTFEQTGEDVVSETQLDLRAGGIFGNVKKLSAASKYEIKTPNGVAGIRGTVFDLNASGILTVFLGSIVHSYYDTSGQLVTKVVNGPCQQLNCNTGAIGPISQKDCENGMEEARSHPDHPVHPPHPPHPIAPPWISPVVGNNGVGNGVDPQPPGNPPINDGPGTGPGNPGNGGGN